MGPSTGPLPASSARKGNSFNEVPCATQTLASHAAKVSCSSSNTLEYSPMPNMHGRLYQSCLGCGEQISIIGGASSTAMFSEEAKSNRQLLSSIRACPYRISTAYEISNAFA